MLQEGNGLKILIADDESALLKKYEIYLQKYFGEVFTAKDGLEAYLVYNDKSPHIVLLDVNMPRLNGLEVLKKIRQKDTKTEVVILSGHNEKERILEAIHHGISGYFIKPIGREELKGILAKIIENLKS